MLTTLDLLLIHVKRCLQSEVFHYLARHRGTSQLFPGFTYFSTRILFANCFYYFRNISYCRLLFFPNRIPSSSAGLSDRSSLILGVTYPEEFICFVSKTLNFSAVLLEKSQNHTHDLPLAIALSVDLPRASLATCLASLTINIYIHQSKHISQ